jgi:AbrB family looped-hinge helix DNA binding protein
MSDDQAKITVESAKVGKRGAVVIPARLRKKFGFEEGSSVLVEEGPDGVVISSTVSFRAQAEQLFFVLLTVSFSSLDTFR